MLTFVVSRSSKLFLYPVVLLVACAGVAAQAQTGEEPIAYIGHGAMFDPDGRELVPNLELIREAQAWYRNDLLAKLDEDQLGRFEELEGRLVSGLELDEQSRLVGLSRLLDWLVEAAEIEDPDRLLGKINVMKVELRWKLAKTAEEVDFRRSPEPFEIAPELAERLRSVGLERPRLPSPQIVTPFGGQQYRDQCLANGVPVPPDWGTAGWISRGLIPKDDPNTAADEAETFISKTLQAEVFTYQSAAPEGMCIALPRYNTVDSIRLLGVICLGKLTSKACFWDNQNGGVEFFPEVGDVVPFSNFGGGNDLVGNVGGVCTDCHAGENPYIIHPTTVLGGLRALGLPTFADDWYEPIVKAGWPQNPGPMGSPAVCAGCHGAGPPGGRFPHLSTELPGYCGTVLDSALRKTMPQGAPGSLVGTPQVVALRNWCGAAPGGNPATRGDPHLTTFDGVRYDLQSAGEFVYLRSARDLEVQTRHTPVATTSTIANAHTGLSSCVSLNTALAARVGTHRVTLQPRHGEPNPEGLELRVDGVLTTVTTQGVDLEQGGRVLRSAVGDGIEIDFPDGGHLIAVPGWWGPPRNLWYLNIDVLDTTARMGVSGRIAPGSWLPALANGGTLGARPAAAHQRHVDLNQKFADSWRVSDWTSLFDYAPGTSTATFTFPGWPPENPPCRLRGTPQAEPLDAEQAKDLCRPIADRDMNDECVFDVMVTGEPGFAKTYLMSQELRAGSTRITVSASQDSSTPGTPVTFTAAVEATAGGKVAPAGKVRFTLDGAEAGAEPVDAGGRATWTTARLEPGEHLVAAHYRPAPESVFLPSASLDLAHTVKGEPCSLRVVVGGIHYPERSCSQSREDFHASVMTNSHFTSKCPRRTPLREVLDISCQDAPIPGFETGSVYQGTACCAAPSRR